MVRLVSAHVHYPVPLGVPSRIGYRRTALGSGVVTHVTTVTTGHGTVTCLKKKKIKITNAKDKVNNIDS